ncbi:MAG: AlbA family DNA-binding domain-containing protein [Pyrinomonadaceae bacterium]
MARRRFRSNQRHEPDTQRSFQEYTLSLPTLQTSRTELMRMIRGGEDTYLELKVRLSNREKIAQEIIALANTDGGTIVFGINDQMRVEGLDDLESVRDELARICREDIVPPIVPFIDGVAFDNGRRILALSTEGRHRPYCTQQGRYYIRSGSEKREATREELSALMDEWPPVAYENVPLLNARMSDIEEALVWSFVREFEGDAFNPAHYREYPTADILEKDLLLAVRRDDERVPTVAGLQLFGKNERVGELLPRTCITIVRYGGATTQAPVVEEQILTGNLLNLYESAIRFIKRYCDLWDTLPPDTKGHSEGDSPVTARPNYHRGGVSEAVANCLIHRDLALKDIPTRILIFERSIEIINPRRSFGLNGTTQKALCYGITQRINAQIASIFSNPAYGISLPGGGLPSLLRSSRIFSGRHSDLHTFNDEFRLRLYGA